MQKQYIPLLNKLRSVLLWLSYKFQDLAMKVHYCSDCGENVFTGKPCKNGENDE